jgi:hypothetical protein
MSKKVTSEAEQKYVKSNGAACPHCGSTEIEADSPSLEDTDISCQVTCNRCEETWTEIWKLAGIFESQNAE